MAIDANAVSIGDTIVCESRISECSWWEAGASYEVVYRPLGTGTGGRLGIRDRGQGPILWSIASLSKMGVFRHVPKPAVHKLVRGDRVKYAGNGAAFKFGQEYQLYVWENDLVVYGFNGQMRLRDCLLGEFGEWRYQSAYVTIDMLPLPRNRQSSRAIPPASVAQPESIPPEWHREYSPSGRAPTPPDPTPPVAPVVPPAFRKRRGRLDHL